MIGPPTGIGLTVGPATRLPTARTAKSHLPSDSPKGGPDPRGPEQAPSALLFAEIFEAVLDDEPISGVQLNRSVDAGNGLGHVSIAVLLLGEDGGCPEIES